MPWYELALLAVGATGGGFVPGIYAKLVAKVKEWANEPEPK